MESRPVYRVAAAGLDPRDVRLIEIVFKHSQYNRYEFVIEPRLVPERVDILVANPAEQEGLRALARLRTLGRKVAVVSALPHGMASITRHAISIDRLTLQLLPILNRVVELELAAPDTRPGAAAQASAAGPAPASTSGVAPGSASAPASSSPAPAPASTPLDAAASREQGAPGETGAPAAEDGPPSNPLNLELPTRDFLREAARKSREGDRAREAAHRFAMPPAEPARRPAAAAPAYDLIVPPLPARPERHAGSGPGVPGPSQSAAPGPAAAPPARPAPAAPPSNLVEFPRSPEAPVQRVRVLVVDDSPTVRQQLSLAFARMGVLCDAVASAAEALRRLAQCHYDLTLVDVVMPDMDGYKLTRQIRRRHRGTPVIILTSRSSPFDLARGALAGCDTYLVKPVPLKRLEAAVAKLLRRVLAIDDLSGLIRLSGEAPPRRAAPSARPAPPQAPDGDPRSQPPRSAGG